jgi:hypothetical protein
MERELAGQGLASAACKNLALSYRPDAQAFGYRF